MPGLPALLITTACVVCLTACGDLGTSRPLPEGIEIGYIGRQHVGGPVVYSIHDEETGRSLIPKNTPGVTIDRMFVPDTNWYTPLVIGELIQDDPAVSPRFVSYFVLDTKSQTHETFQMWSEVQKRLADGHVTDLPEINDMVPAKRFYWAHSAP